MAVIKTKYEQTKIYDEPLYKEFSSTQEIFSVKSIDDSGVFELTGRRYSKMYVLSDINFSGVTDAEQKSIIINFSKVLKTVPCRFSYCVANEYVDEKEFNEYTPSRLADEFLASRLRHAINTYDPDCIVCTMVFAAQAVDLLKEFGLCAENIVAVTKAALGK